MASFSYGKHFVQIMLLLPCIRAFIFIEQNQDPVPFHEVQQVSPEKAGHIQRIEESTFRKLEEDLRKLFTSRKNLPTDFVIIQELLAKNPEAFQGKVPRSGNTLEIPDKRKYQLTYRFPLLHTMPGRKLYPIFERNVFPLLHVMPGHSMLRRNGDVGRIHKRSIPNDQYIRTAPENKPKNTQREYENQHLDDLYSAVLSQSFKRSRTSRPPKGNSEGKSSTTSDGFSSQHFGGKDGSFGKDQKDSSLFSRPGRLSDHTDSKENDTELEIESIHKELPSEENVGQLGSHKINIPGTSGTKIREFNIINILSRSNGDESDGREGLF